MHEIRENPSYMHITFCHYDKLQKLSIYGDLGYLSKLNDKALLANVHPQDTMEAAPLPIKIKVERI